MQKKSLFLLIQSLSKSEKRYIRLRTNAFTSNDKEYMWLYDLLLKMEEYDEDFLKKAFKKLNSKRSLSAIKNYLYYEILDILKQYHQKDTTEYEILNAYYESHILYQRGLLEDAYTLVKKLKKKLQKLNCFEYYMLGLLKLELRIIKHFFLKETTSFDEQRKLLKEWENILDLSKEHLNINSLNIEFIHFISYDKNRKDEKFATQIQNYLQNPNIQNKDAIKHLKARGIATRLKANIYANLREYENSKNTLVDFKKELYTITKDFNDDNITYIEVCYHILMMQFGGENSDEVLFRTHYKKLLEQKFTHITNKSNTIFACYKSLFSSISNGLKVADLLDWQKIEANIKKYKTNIQHNILLQMYVYGICSSLNIQNYHKALEWIAMYENDTSNNSDHSFFFCSKVCTILGHYEINNYQLVINIIPSIKKRLKQRNQFTETKNAVLNSFLNLSKLQNTSYNLEKSEKELAIFNDFLSLLQGLDPKTIIDIKYDLRLEEWIQNKIKTISIS